MGTNYYAHDKDPCKTCHREWPSLHIGKSSHGWKFCFAKYDDPKLHSAKDWWEHLERTGARILDEYGRPATVEELKEWVDTKQDGLWEHTARDQYRYYGNREDHEYLDPEGYRFSINPDFS